MLSISPHPIINSKQLLVVAYYKKWVTHVVVVVYQNIKAVLELDKDKHNIRNKIKALDTSLSSFP